MKYVIGDRVRAIRDRDHIRTGDTGTIVSFDYGMGVAWDNYHVHGHDLTGCCENGHGWWVNEEDIAPIEDDCADYDMTPATDKELASLLCF